MTIQKNLNHIYTKLTFVIPYGINHHGSNLTKEALEDAIVNFGPVPIMNDRSSVIGLAGKPLYDNAENVVEWDDENQQCRITINGVLYNANVEIYPREILDEKITSMELVGISLNGLKENSNE